MFESPWGRIPLADAHVHFFSRKFFDMLAAQQGAPIDSALATAGIELPEPEPVRLAERWVAQMDHYGVDRAALIASLPGDEDSVASAIRAFPQRFRGYFVVNALAPDAQVSTEAAFANGLHGVCFFPAMHCYSMASPEAEAVISVAEQNKAVVFVHCGVLSVGIRAKLGLASRFDMRFSNPIDVHAAALRHPGVRFVIPHFGAGYFREALMVASLCPNVYFDSSSSNAWMRFEGLDLKTVFARALEIVGPSRIVFGSDSSFFPRGWVSQIAREQAGILHELGLDAITAAKIFAGNFDALFQSV